MGIEQRRAKRMTATPPDGELAEKEPEGS